MSDHIKHECGIALLRLKKPLPYYREKYGTSFYGLNKMYLLMEKQHNRGQDGAGLANIKFDVPPGARYISRIRSNNKTPIQDVFEKVNRRFQELEENDPEKLNDPLYLKEHFGFTGELFLGHLRYGTFGKNSIESCHPFLRQNNWMTRNLVVAGNFNLTNVDELFGLLVELGQHPKQKTDTVTVLEKIGHFLDEENQILFDQYKSQGYSNTQITKKIAEQIDIAKILTRSAADWDGGYAMAGLLGHGDAFVLRDPSGIRPAYWYEDDEVSVVASERPVIQTAFNIKDASQITEIMPGHALVIKKNGQIAQHQVREPLERKACSFERIYFSRGSDLDIYKERKELGRNVVPQILEEIDFDLKNSVFSYIPNTAETAFFGMVKGVEEYMDEVKLHNIKVSEFLDDEKLLEILNRRPRVEKIAIKDAKLRTFITQDDARDDMVAHVYDITYGTVKAGTDNLIVLDDSIVRGTTLKKSILRILDRLGPKKIIVASSAPQIRYPDCYGIDMAKMGDFIAFQAAVALIKDKGMEDLLQTVYQKCLDQAEQPKEMQRNYVKEVYAPFTVRQINEKIAELLKPKDLNAEVVILFQGIEQLHKACPHNLGDWYFTGEYPTPGGNKVVNRAFINYMEGKNERAY